MERAPNHTGSEQQKLRLQQGLHSFRLYKLIIEEERFRLERSEQALIKWALEQK